MLNELPALTVACVLGVVAVLIATSVVSVRRALPKSVLALAVVIACAAAYLASTQTSAALLENYRALAQLPPSGVDASPLAEVTALRDASATYRWGWVGLMVALAFGLGRVAAMTSVGTGRKASFANVILIPIIGVVLLLLLPSRTAARA